MEEKPRRSRTPIAIVAFLLVAAAALIGWAVYQRQHEEPPPVVAQPQLPDAGVEEEPKSVNLADGDALLKAAATGLSSEELLQKWLAQPDLVRRLVAAVAQVAEGESPRATLSFLGPGGLFSVDVKKVVVKKKKKQQTFISARSTARYDVIARVLGSVDTRKVGELYATLRPYVDAAFREIAPAGKRFEPTFLRAVDHLAAVPISDAPLEVTSMEVGVGYRFTDPKLEALSAAQKQLLRMGPANARVIVGKLKEFRAALGETDGGS